MGDDQADVRRLRQRLGRYITDAAFRELPALKNMSAQQIRDFGEIVSRGAGDMAHAIANLASKDEERE